MLPQKVLVTGAAGLLGGELCGRFVDQGTEILALVNKNPEVRRNDGRPVEGITVLRGDVTKPGLGITDRAALSGIDRIVHCAAVTDFTPENEVHRAVNVGGTKNVLSLSEQMGTPLVHISTAYVCGDREGAIGEDDLDLNRSFTNGYEATKARAEAAVRDSRADWAIARPSIILGDHSEGRTRSFDTIYPILKVFAEGWVRVMPAKKSATLNLVPIDHVCDGIIAIANRFDDARGQCFHLCASEPTPLRAFPDTLSRFKGLFSPEWVDPETFDISSLRPAERRFFQRGAEVYTHYFSRSPQFCDRNYRAVFGHTCPPTDENWWWQVVNYAVKERFIRPRGEERG